jgi:membrane-bound lytic murein transglycosylase D
VDDVLAQAGLPPFLAAVPLVESGYSNWGAPDGDEEQSRAPGTIPGRGLWMFIAPTARQYGLRVDDTVDERLDPEKETAAAVALLSDMYDRYGDWGLALSAYNMGPRAVDAAIEAGGTRDPWELTARGLLNEYAAQVMAAALVLEAPELVE